MPTKKKTTQAAAKKTARTARKSAQNQAFDEMQAKRAEPVETPEETLDADTPEACPACDEPVVGEHICEAEGGDLEDQLDAVLAEADGEATSADFEAGAQEGIAAGEKELAGIPADDDSDDEDDDDELSAHGMAGEDEPQRTRYLRCDLTDADRDEKRARREDLDGLIERMQGELSIAEATVKSLKKRIDGVGAEGLALSKCIRDGYENRNVPCEERPCPNDQGVKGVATVRLDTLERIEWRELTHSERQGRLFS